MKTVYELAMPNGNLSKFDFQAKGDYLDLYLEYWTENGEGLVETFRFQKVVAYQCTWDQACNLDQIHCYHKVVDVGNSAYRKLFLGGTRARTSSNDQASNIHHFCIYIDGIGALDVLCHGCTQLDQGLGLQEQPPKNGD